MLLVIANFINMEPSFHSKITYYLPRSSPLKRKLIQLSTLPLNLQHSKSKRSVMKKPKDHKTEIATKKSHKFVATCFCHIKHGHRKKITHHTAQTLRKLVILYNSFSLDTQKQQILLYKAIKSDEKKKKKLSFRFNEFSP